MTGFLSTPSARRATILMLIILWITCYFYPRPPRGGRPEPLLPNHGVCSISIHALREEGDCTAFSTNSSSRLFLSTPSARRATRHCPMWTLLRVFLSTPSARRATRSSEVIDDVSVISIHALREEGDTRRHQNDSDRHGFLSTPSARRATPRRHHAC